jgi:hypothetical protein
MKNITKIVFIAGLMIILASCKKDFLEIADPNNPTAETYYTSVNNAQLATNGVYGQLKDERLFFGELFYITCYSTGEALYIHPESRYTDFNNYNYNATNDLIGNYYQGWYRIVGRANAVITGINGMLAAGTYSSDEVASLKKMKGQCYFLRGFAYSWLVRSYGEKMPSNPAYNDNTPGVIISDSILLSKEQMYKDRSTCSEVYKYIVKDFQMAESLLPDFWPTTELGKATKAAAQAYLGETYMYLQDWTNAKIAFDKVMSYSQYKLVADFSQNFDYKHIHNSESIFEVCENNQTISYETRGTYVYRLLAKQSWGTTKIPTATVNHFSSTVILNDKTLAAGLASKSLAVGSLQKSYIDSLYKVSVPLNGNSWKDKDSYLAYIRPLTTIPFYKTDGVTLQPGVRIWLDAVSPKDPRISATVYIPKADSLQVFDPTTKTWSTKLYDFSDYGWKKYIPDSVEVEAAQAAGMGNDGHMSMNFRVMRLDDVYLYYAEVMHNLGDDVTAKEFINRIVRRANNKPITIVSDVDVNPADVMAEIRNQTYLEFCLEAKIWFHFRRWNREVIEWGSLGFKANKNECLPIPQGEFDSNPAITRQNMGYN